MSTSATRRDFLKTSAAVTAAALVNLQVSQMAHAAGSDIIKIGMVGCGGRCPGAAINSMSVDKGVRLVAMCDIVPARVKAQRASLKQQKPDQVMVDDDHCFDGFDGYKKVIDSCDVVLIANAAKFHPFHAKAAIEAGKHVFVEKPHAIDPYGIKMLNAAASLAKEKKLGLASGLHSRHDPRYIEAIKRIHDGQIGEIISIEENFLRSPYQLYQRQPGMGEIQYQCSNQYHFVWLSGDDVPQSLVHNMDRATWALKEQPPVKCHGMGGRSTSIGEVYGNVFDHHGVVYEYANGVRVYAFCRTIDGCYGNADSIVLGSKGQCYVTHGRIVGQTPWVYKGEDANPYDIEHAVLLKSIRAGNPVNNGDYMARSTLVTIMGQLSCYTGEEMRWDRVVKSDFAYAPKPEDCTFEMEPPVKPGPDKVYPVFATPGRTKLL
ncbi:MAG: Gfo/Idh/MocA family oxidoreductase [Planctomycetota bacterium]|nr:Gfo/Idh/MocA family oxidoreductase [Planctomycetota bacterium]